MTHAPTPRLRRELAGPSLWHDVEHVEETTSTNDLALERAEQGTPPGLIVVADRQSAGRGRLGRRWEDRGRDRPGASLLASFLLEPPEHHLTLVPLAAGLAVLDAADHVGVHGWLKWPNDVFVTGAPGRLKCGGVLVEHHAEGGAAPRLVIGVGLNVDWRGLRGGGVSSDWTSLAEAADGEVDRWEVLGELAVALPAWLERVATDAESLRTVYARRCLTLGSRVEVTTGGGRHVGEAAAIAPDGALVVTSPDGAVHVTAGDVSSVRRAD